MVYCLVTFLQMQFAPIRTDRQLILHRYDASKKSAKSSRGNLYLQVFISNKVYPAAYTMELKSNLKDALHLFCKEAMISIALVVDPSGEHTIKSVRKLCTQVRTTPVDT